MLAGHMVTDNAVQYINSLQHAWHTLCASDTGQTKEDICHATGNLVKDSHCRTAQPLLSTHHS